MNIKSGILTGPWVEGFFFTVPVPVKSKSNFRRGVKSKSWDKFSKFEEDMRLLAQRALPSSWETGDKAKPLASRPVVVNFIYARSTLDTANLSKSVLDGCEGLVFHTDASVRGCSAVSERSTLNQWGLVGFARLDAGAEISEVAKALNALTDECLKNV